eukprot:CAMPEP_0182421688 /NCGR_PEP_ID=MMETSP1167-20130531/7142_1 /TAXON_ID=2988 /ORGANISM="Mallomonas Sp, Strain CCMP3275" /LENGTH=499 /DNA_ID=CAMNT_0024599051 /DNA_START=84 /DNA_END=1583 /DNA_ORIENTATION=-
MVFEKLDSFPYKEMSILVMINFASSLSITSLLSYAGFMVLDLGLVNDIEKAGYYAGALCGSLFFGRLLTSFAWGLMADIFGRRIVLLLSCMSIFVFNLIFGFASNYWEAITIRFIMGLINPIVGITKTLVTELCNETHETKGMGLTTGAWSLGMVIGPGIGGYLARPAVLYPSTLGRIPLLISFPYLLPNIVVSVFALISAIFTFLYFPETLPEVSLSNPKETPRVGNILRTKGVIPIMSSYFLVSLMSIVLDSVFPLWVICSFAEGGFNLSLPDVGKVLSLSGVILVAYTAFVYPLLGSLLGPKNGFLCGMLVGAVGTTSFPYIRAFKDMPGLWLLLVMQYVIIRMGTSLAFSSSSLMLNRSVSTDVRATVNGINMTFGSVAKTIGPFIGSYIFAWTIDGDKSYPFDYCFSFFIMGFIGVLSAFIGTYITTQKQQGAKYMAVNADESQCDDDTNNDIIGIEMNDDHVDCSVETVDKETQQSLSTVNQTGVDKSASTAP